MLKHLLDRIQVEVPSISYWYCRILDVNPNFFVYPTKIHWNNAEKNSWECYFSFTIDLSSFLKIRWRKSEMIEWDELPIENCFPFHEIVDEILRFEFVVAESTKRIHLQSKQDFLLLEFLFLNLRFEFQLFLSIEKKKTPLVFLLNHQWHTFFSWVRWRSSNCCS